VSVRVQLNNIGGAGASAINATLSTASPGVTIASASSPYPNIAAGGSAQNTTPFVFTIACSAACGSTLNFTLTVTYTGGPSPKVFNFSLASGAAGTPVTASYAGPAVPIPDGGDLSGTLPGAPALATINVSGITGSIFDVNFRIDGSACSATAGSTTVGIDHTFVNDLQIKLTSPGGTTVTLIQNTDGSGNNFCQTVLDDESGGASIQSVVSAQAPFTGSFTPANPLSAFDGQNPNGTWTLSVQDFFSFDIGSIRAFSLEITPAACATQVLDVCLQDDSNAANKVLFNSTTGFYTFCCGSTFLTGTGVMSKKGNVLTLTHNAGNRRVTITVDLAQKKGTATLQSPPGQMRCTITDRNTTNNVCACAPPPV
jgi:subtilisin-like proprotein convertase family protein